MCKLQIWLELYEALDISTHTAKTVRGQASRFCTACADMSEQRLLYLINADIAEFVHDIGKTVQFNRQDSVVQISKIRDPAML
jgi:hypothetical protein